MTAAAASHCLSGIELSIEENIGPARDVDEFCARAALGNPTGANECHLDELRQHEVGEQRQEEERPVQPRQWDEAECLANGENGSQAPTAMITAVVTISGQLARLWRKGIRSCG